MPPKRPADGSAGGRGGGKGWPGRGPRSKRVKDEESKPDDAGGTIAARDFPFGEEGRPPPCFDIATRRGCEAPADWDSRSHANKEANR